METAKHGCSVAVMFVQYESARMPNVAEKLSGRQYEMFSPQLQYAAQAQLLTSQGESKEFAEASKSKCASPIGVIHLLRTSISVPPVVSR